ncbi:hypothetical protein [Vallitalea maricola]|uniref:Uncharacterized protein n=1 Tax=Vallitalea maricola TaxID=3074433 RepID=A0ACB5UIU8_9FIRM|nr:hypothetical protein AN2V17_17010 [Vallitalea sp. AN17-2]
MKIKVIKVVEFVIVSSLRLANNEWTCIFILNIDGTIKDWDFIKEWTKTK